MFIVTEYAALKYKNNVFSHFKCLMISVVLAWLIFIYFESFFLSTTSAKYKMQISSKMGFFLRRSICFANGLLAIMM